MGSSLRLWEGRFRKVREALAMWNPNDYAKYLVEEKPVKVEPQPLAICTPFYYSFHFLDEYFTALTRLNYPKDLISLCFTVQGKDDTYDILQDFQQRFKDTYHTIKLEKRPLINKGKNYMHILHLNVCAVRTWLVEHSKPLDVLFMGHDNFLPPNTILRLLEGKALGGDIVAGFYSFFQKGLGFTSFFDTPDNKMDSALRTIDRKIWFPECLYGRRTWNWSVGMDATFIRREVLEKVNFNIRPEKLLRSDDVEFCDQAMQLGFKVMTDYGLYVPHWGFNVQFLQPPQDGKLQILCSVTEPLLRRRALLKFHREMQMDQATRFQTAIDELQEQTCRCHSLRDLFKLSETFEGGLITIRTMQFEEEILPFLKIVQNLKPQAICEIGTCEGGTLWLFCKVASDNATIISVDLPEGKFGGGYAEHKIPFYQSFAKNGQQLHLIREDSHKAETLEKVKDALGRKKLDLLFIDGDHTYEGVKKDFEMYSPLVREGGLIAFHDVVEHTFDPTCRVSDFWNEIKLDYKTRTFVGNWKQGECGIGVIYPYKVLS